MPQPTLPFTVEYFRDYCARLWARFNDIELPMAERVLTMMNLPTAAEKLAVQCFLRHESHDVLRLYLRQLEDYGQSLFAR